MAFWEGFKLGALSYDRLCFIFDFSLASSSSGFSHHGIWDGCSRVSFAELASWLASHAFVRYPVGQYLLRTSRLSIYRTAKEYTSYAMLCYALLFCDRIELNRMQRY